MSKLKKFLDRRAEGIAREQQKKNKATQKNNLTGDDDLEEDPNLTDDEFWSISKQYISESKNSDKDQVEILQSILEKYSPLKIEQFAKRYYDLNK